MEPIYTNLYQMKHVFDNTHKIIKWNKIKKIKNPWAFIENVWKVGNIIIQTNRKSAKVGIFTY